MLNLLAQASDYTYTTYTTTSSTDEGAVAAVMAMLGIILLITIPLIIFVVVCMWKMFEKAGVEGWKAIIPVYNGWVLAEIAGKPGWWGIVGIAGVIPFVGWVASIAALVLGIIISIELAKSFGKDTGFAVLLILLPFIGYAMLGFGSAKYVGPGGVGAGKGGAKPAAPKAA